MALCHGLSGGTVASLHYREPVKIIQFLSGNDQLGRIHVNRIVPFSVDLHLAGRRKVCSLDIIGVIRLRHNLNGIQRGIIDSHTHLCPLKRILSVICILLSVEKIVLQGLQIHLIIFGVSSCLMILENISLMDTYTVHNLCCHLVCRKIFFLFLKSEIIPHHILCLEQIFILHILHGQSHGRQMITIHNQYHILRIICQLISQLFDKIIHLMDLIYIILPLIVQLVRRGPGNCDLRIFQHRF